LPHRKELSKEDTQRTFTEEARQEEEGGKGNREESKDETKPRKEKRNL